MWTIWIVLFQIKWRFYTLFFLVIFNMQIMKIQFACVYEIHTTYKCLKISERKYIPGIILIDKCQVKGWIDNLYILSLSEVMISSTYFIKN